MRMLIEQFTAFIRRDFLIARRYRGGFVVAPISVFFELAGAYYLSRAIGTGFRPDGFAYFPFLLIGTAVTQIVMASMNAFVDSVHDAQVSGTMETLVTTPTSPLRVMVLSAGTLMIHRFILFSAYVVFGFSIFRIAIPHPDVPMLALLFLATVLITLGFGILAASVQIYFQRGGGLVWLFGTMVWLLCGSMFPVSALPRWLQWVSKLLPVTYLLDGFRRSLLGSGSSGYISALALILFGAILAPISIAVFSAVLRDARRRGTLSLY